MAEQNKESSMEEILSSIKRIIAEDKAIEPERSDKQATAALNEEEETSQDKPMADNVTPIAPLPRNITAKKETSKKTPVVVKDSDDGVLELTNEVKDNGPSSAQGVFGDRRKDERLINDQKLDAMRQSLSALVAMDGTSAPAPKKPANGTSLEELTRDLMRPMLKEWLDENLPQLVEGMVAREIQRIKDK
ncbi:MAG: DUF2497 domain-containing protein [Parasphingorhabdus sp.]|uniref:DUF2497 domain-containing protein n=1 Tax=Parasphingorhabdus sp. TaxID=2709688 RepID=UPI003296C07F